MQVCILCGGTGTRLRDVSELTPKALIPIGGIPIIIHIMSIYAHYGHKDFILALGHKQEAFKHYFYNYELINNDIELEIGKSIANYHIHGTNGHGWKVILADTGERTLKGGRLKQVEKYVRGDTFLLTYGDAVANIDLNALLAFHQSHGRIATVTGIHPTSKFGELKHNSNGQITSYIEKAQDDGCLTNAGFFVFNRKIFDYLTVDCDLEIGPLERLVEMGELFVYQHKGYWKCMDTPKDMGELQQEWETGKARWKIWD